MSVMFLSMRTLNLDEDENEAEEYMKKMNKETSTLKEYKPKQQHLKKFCENC